ncbi:MAG: hypothetical protein M1826_007495 [Phylliscum demangeonii]|nr:MAG: hypothetical protein M1826_007495 [Phylliscum demangeonii]
MASAFGHDANIHRAGLAHFRASQMHKADQAWFPDHDISQTRSESDEHQRLEERAQLLKQNNQHFQQRVAEERTRHLINPDGEFTPENDAGYQADIKQIKLEFEQRMTWVNKWEKQAHPKIDRGMAARLRKDAERLRDQAMKSAYERHDLRNGGWSDRAAYHKRELAIRRLKISRETEIGLWRASNMREDKTVKRYEKAYARERKMPTDAEQKAGFPPPPSSPPSSSTHQLSLLPALEHRLLHTARSSAHQLQHSVKALAPAFYTWEKRVSGSQAPGDQKAGLEAELKAASSW